MTTLHCAGAERQWALKRSVEQAGGRPSSEMVPALQAIGADLEVERRPVFRAQFARSISWNFMALRLSLIHGRSEPAIAPRVQPPFAESYWHR